MKDTNFVQMIKACQIGAEYDRTISEDRNFDLVKAVANIRGTSNWQFCDTPTEQLNCELVYPKGNIKARGEDDQSKKYRDLVWNSGIIQSPYSLSMKSQLSEIIPKSLQSGDLFKDLKAVRLRDISGFPEIKGDKGGVCFEFEHLQPVMSQPGSS